MPKPESIGEINSLSVDEIAEIIKDLKNWDVSCIKFDLDMCYRFENHLNADQYNRFIFHLKNFNAASKTFSPPYRHHSASVLIRGRAILATLLGL